MFTCHHCREAFPVKPLGPRRPRYCSTRCRTQASYARKKAAGRAYTAKCSVAYPDCEICGSTFAARTKRRTTCGEACEKARNARRQRERYHADPEAAARRVREQRAAWTPEQLERERERARAWREQAGYFAAKRAGDVKRRVRKSTAVVEQFDAVEIYERDGWRCGICSRKVNRALTWPHPMSPSLDHVLPLSLGGEHSRANARLAHLRCNISRGNRMGAEQLALIG